MIHKGKMVKIRINQMSRHGLQFKLLEKAKLETNDTIKVQFNADDPVKMPISRDLRVKKLITPKDIGCEFLSFDHQGNLGKYFLFYF